MEFRRRLYKMGDSRGIIIPKDLLSLISSETDEIIIHVDDNNVVTLKRARIDDNTRPVEEM